MAFFAPAKDSTVRSLSSGPDWVRPMIVTSSGIWSFSISKRTKSKAVCDAEGKPTSISLKPVRMKRSKKRSFCSGFMGSMSAWLPSRKSVLIQMGALVMVLEGQVRSLKPSLKGGKGIYFLEGSEIMIHLHNRKLELFSVASSVLLEPPSSQGRRLPKSGYTRLPNGHRTLGPATDR